MLGLMLELLMHLAHLTQLPELLEVLELLMEPPTELEQTMTQEKKQVQ